MSPRRASIALVVLTLAVWGIEPSAATFDHVTTNAGNTFSAALDWTAPTVSLADPGAHLRGTVTLTATASDADSGIQSVRVERSPAGAGSWTQICSDPSEPYSCSLDTTALSDGLYDLRAVATDNADNAATSVIAGRRVDNTAPTASLADPGANLRGTVTLAASASDAGSGVASVKVQRSPAGAATWTDVCSLTAGPYDCPLNTTTLADGLYDFRTVATDQAGNATSSTVVASRRVDNTAPAAAVTDPGANLRATVTLSATSTDSGSGVASVTLQRSPAGANTWTDVCTDTITPYQCSLDTTTLTDGLYDLRAVSTDAAGNITTSAVVANRRVDNTPPTAAMSDPGNYIRATVDLAATATDTGSGVASVRFQRAPANAGTWTDCLPVDTTSPYTCTFDTTTVADGLYDFLAIATDAAGNVTTSALVEDRRVDNTRPTATGISSTNVGNGTAGKIESGDTLTYTFSEAMAPNSIMTGWNGSSTNVRLRVVNNGSNDQVVMQTTGGGTVNLGRVSMNAGFVGADTNLTANMALVTNGTEVRVTLTQSGGTGPPRAPRT